MHNHRPWVTFRKAGLARLIGFELKTDELDREKNKRGGQVQ
jgi:hypothetical protein